MNSHPIRGPRTAAATLASSRWLPRTSAMATALPSDGGEQHETQAPGRHGAGSSPARPPAGQPAPARRRPGCYAAAGALTSTTPPLRPHLPARLRVGGGPALHAAVGEPEDGAVQRADDAAVLDLALVERPAAVRAAVGERVHLALPARDDDPDAVHLGVARLALGQVGLAQHGRPLVRALLEHRLVDADALRVGEVPAEVAAQARARSRPRAPNSLPDAREPRLRATSEAPKSASAATFDGGVHEPDAAHGVAGRLAVGPVAPAGERGGQRRDDAELDQAVRGGAGRLPAQPVEQDRARPGADRQVGEERMQRVAEPACR